MLYETYSGLCCSRLERFPFVKLNIFVFKTQEAIRSVVNFYSSGVVNNDRRIGSSIDYRTRIRFSKIVEVAKNQVL
jgi:hypothetical protein